MASTQAKGERGTGRVWTQHWVTLNTGPGLSRQLQGKLVKGPQVRGWGEDARLPVSGGTHGPNVPRGVGVLPGQPKIQHVALSVGGGQPAHGKV